MLEAAQVSHDQYLCIDRIRMGLLANNVIAPGAMTFLLNLLTNYRSERNEDEILDELSLAGHADCVSSSLRLTVQIPFQDTHNTQHNLVLGFAFTSRSPLASSPSASAVTVLHALSAPSCPRI